MARTPFKMKSGNSPLYKNLGDKPKLPTSSQDNTRVVNSLANQESKHHNIAITKEFNRKHQVGKKTWNPREANKTFIDKGDFTNQTDSLPSNYNATSSLIDQGISGKNSSGDYDSMTRTSKYNRGMIKSKTKGSNSPLHKDYQTPKESRKEHKDYLNSQMYKNIGGGEKSINEITEEGQKEYMKKGSKHFTEIAKKTEKKVQQAKSYNKSRANYLKYAGKLAKGFGH